MARTDRDRWDLATSVGATATMVAAQRALSSDERLIDDPYAAPMVRKFFSDRSTEIRETRASLEAALAKAQELFDRSAARQLAEEDQRFVEPRLAHLIGLEDRTASDKGDLFAGWRLFFERISESADLVQIRAVEVLHGFRGHHRVGCD